MNRDSHRAAICVVVVLVSISFILTWYFFFSSSFRLSHVEGPVFPVSVFGKTSVLAAHGLEGGEMPAMQQALRQHSRHVETAEVFVDEAPGKQELLTPAEAKAKCYISLKLNSGCVLRSRFATVDWKHLDREMAGAVERCMNAYFDISKQSAKKLSNAVIVDL